MGGNAVVKIRSGLDDGHAGKGALVGLEQSFTLGCNNDQTLFQDKQHEVMSTVGGQSAYAIGNGQVHQLYLQKKCGALNCMVDPMKIMQEIPTERTSQEVCAPTIMCSTDKMLTKES